MENYAIRRLQEQFIMQIAAQVLFEEGVKYMEQEMEEIDQRERIENPPREIRMWSGIVYLFFIWYVISLKLFMFFVLQFKILFVILRCIQNKTEGDFNFNKKAHLRLYSIYL